MSAVLLAVFALMLVSCVLAVGVVAVAVAGMHSFAEPTVVSMESKAATTTVVSAVTTTLRPSTTRKTARSIVSTTVWDGSPSTTFLEYYSTTTTLVDVVSVPADSCSVNFSYHGFRTCGAKNVAWFDSWS